MNRFALYLTATAVLLLDLASAAPAQQQELIGAGATFPYPLYSKTVDFGGSDAVTGEEKIKAAGGKTIVRQ
jgi:hypothetical protein